ncbi:MAG: hypothetical protein JRN52_02125 [Nitrososphaerota archaeon]|nr:hypothetical protein [Nitrososphaerota archaeon]
MQRIQRQSHSREEKRVIRRSHISDILEGAVLNDAGESVVRAPLEEGRYDQKWIKRAFLGMDEEFFDRM